MTFFVTKTYPHSLGLSACFRQPYADSHCRDPHGYPLSFELIFAAEELNDNNWVIDFGGLKGVKQFLVDTFDHRTVLAANDPALHDLQIVYRKHGFKEILVLPGVGCERFAQYVAVMVEHILSAELQAGEHRGLRLVSVECREHAGNSATYHK